MQQNEGICDPCNLCLPPCHTTHAKSKQVRLQRHQETKNIDTQRPLTSRPFLFSVCLNMNDKHLMKSLTEIWTWL